MNKLLTLLLKKLKKTSPKTNLGKRVYLLYSNLSGLMNPDDEEWERDEATFGLPTDDKTRDLVEYNLIYIKKILINEYISGNLESTGLFYSISDNLATIWGEKYISLNEFLYINDLHEITISKHVIDCYESSIKDIKGGKEDEVCLRTGQLLSELKLPLPLKKDSHKMNKLLALSQKTNLGKRVSLLYSNFSYIVDPDNKESERDEASFSLLTDDKTRDFVEYNLIYIEKILVDEYISGNLPSTKLLEGISEILAIIWIEKYISLNEILYIKDLHEMTSKYAIDCYKDFIKRIKEGKKDERCLRTGQLLSELKLPLPLKKDPHKR